MTMNSALVLAVLAGLAFIVLTELIAAVLPLVLVVALVPREERRDLAELLAAADSSRRLRLWPALRVAVAARRRQKQRQLNPRTRPGSPPRSPLDTHLR
jgi:hypothetical protein